MVKEPSELGDARAGTVPLPCIRQSGAPRKSGLQTVLAKPRAVIVASLPSSNDEAPQLRFDVPPEDSARRCEMFKPSPTFRPRGGHVHVALTYVNPARETYRCVPPECGSGSSELIVSRSLSPASGCRAPSERLCAISPPSHIAIAAPLARVPH